MPLNCRLGLAYLRYFRTSTFVSGQKQALLMSTFVFGSNSG